MICHYKPVYDMNCVAVVPILIVVIRTISIFSRSLSAIFDITNVILSSCDVTNSSCLRQYGNNRYKSGDDASLHFFSQKNFNHERSIHKLDCQTIIFHTEELLIFHHDDDVATVEPSTLSSIIYTVNSNHLSRLYNIAATSMHSS